MTKITFTDTQGKDTVVDAEDGESLMQAGLNNNIEGIIADCGGHCSCATCHVYVDAEFMDVVGGPDELEESMLDFKDNRTEGSRLSCQIQVTPELEGMHVTVAD